MKLQKISFSKIVLFLIIMIGLISLYYKIYPLTPKVIIGGKTFYLEVAATEAEKNKGLGYRDSLKTDMGMVFPYDRKDYFPFWMKGMNFPLDFLWIDDNTIVDISRNVPVMTGSATTTVRPSQPVNKIIEFNAGFIDVNKIQVGDTVIFKN